ncbi:MAG: hypothetical protein PUP93_29135 [Rhizonema sp. NSF051]|nr:hypothetical protein [Rhizonema sp. NSF051]
MINIIGIDPGKTGGIAVLSLDSTLISLQDMPLNAGDDISIVGLKEIIGEFTEKDKAIIEITHAMSFKDKDGKERQQSTSSMLNYGMEVGRIEGMLFMTGVKFKEVQSISWMRSMGVRGKTSGKYNGIEVALKLFPSADIGNKNGRADALLMVEYYRRILSKGQGAIAA